MLLDNIYIYPDCLMIEGDGKQMMMKVMMMMVMIMVGNFWNPLRVLSLSQVICWSCSDFRLNAVG
jgi:hypothetical protein